MKESEHDMTLVNAICQRRSIRGFLDQPVPQALLDEIFQLAGKAPSNCNVQPWKVYVASGALKDRLRQQMTERVKQGIPKNPDYDYRGDFEGEYRKRQVECAVAMYSKMGITRDDREGRQYAVLRNYQFFDAPHIAFVGMDRSFGTTVAVDVGMYAQTLMLAMTAFGLGSCPMGTMRDYPDLVRAAFGIGDEIGILFGIAFGYEDPEIPANQTRTSREPLVNSVMFRDKGAE